MISGLRRFNFRLVARLVGMLMVVMAVSMVLPFIVSVIYRDGAQFDLMISGVLILSTGLILMNIVGNGAEYELHEKESFWITGLAWLLVPIIGAIPYLLTGVVDNFTDAAFESFSGFTTTGSSVMVDVDNTPEGLLVWRSLTQWIGGLGLMLFVIAWLRQLNVGSMQLYDAEFSGTVQRKLHPRLSQGVSRMWRIYGVISLLLFLLLLACGNGFIDAFCLALSTVSTGGFMPHSGGMACYSPATLTTLTVFMFLSGINVALMFKLISGNGSALIKDEEFHVYAIIFVCAAILVVVGFLSEGNPLAYSVQYAFFHVASTISTCGFTMPSPERWPLLVSAVSFVLVLVGASAGSTGGGIKVKRLMLVVKYVYNYLGKILRPHLVRVVKVNGAMIPNEYVGKVFAFVFLYLCFVVGGAFVLTLCGVDIPNAMCMAAANISNLGPSTLLNNLGGSIDYASLMGVGKWTLITLMVVGRVEIFAILAIFSPAYWRRN